MNSLVARYLTLSTLIILVCVSTGLAVWTLFRFTQIEYWSPGLRFYGNDMMKSQGVAISAASNLKEGTWFHLIRVREDGGVKVDQVDAGSPADKVGLRSGDVITSVNGLDLRSPPEAWFQMRLRSSPGDLLEVTWFRSGEAHSGVMALGSNDGVNYTLEVSGQELVMSVEAMTWFQRGPYLIYPFVLLFFGTWIGFR